VIVYTAEEVAEFISASASAEFEGMNQDEIAAELDQHRDHMISGGYRFGETLYEGDAVEAGAHQTSMIVNGVRYSVIVSKDDDGITDVKFITDPPPRGLDRIRYEWTGRLQEGGNA
jgi:hypothetical protein